MKQLRILVVDDDEDFAESLADALELGGHEVTLAHSGEAAMDLVSRQAYDITFMDVKLPGRNGVESFFEIRQIRPSARVVMMTGYSVPQLLEQAVENGAWGVLHKPLEIDKIVRMVKQVKPCGVLVADDDPDFIESIEAILAKEGYNVFVAHNGEEAVRKVSTGEVDVMILDLRMPILSGLGTYMRLKAMGRCIPTIIVSAYLQEEGATVSTMESLCVHGVLSKPFNPKELFDAIDAITASEDGTCARSTEGSK